MNLTLSFLSVVTSRFSIASLVDSTFFIATSFEEKVEIIANSSPPNLPNIDSEDTYSLIVLATNFITTSPIGCP